MQSGSVLERHKERDTSKQMVFSKVFASTWKSHVHKNVQASLMFFWKVSKRNCCLLLRTDYLSSSVLIKIPPGKFYNSVLLFTLHVLLDSQNQWCSKTKKPEQEIKFFCILCTFPLKILINYNLCKLSCKLTVSEYRRAKSEKYIWQIFLLLKSLSSHLLTSDNLSITWIQCI